MDREDREDENRGDEDREDETREDEDREDEDREDEDREEEDRGPRTENREGGGWSGQPRTARWRWGRVDTGRALEAARDGV